VQAYRRWRDAKLRARSRGLQELRCEIGSPGKLRESEVARLLDGLARGNLAIYASAEQTDEKSLIALCAQLGLRRPDLHFLAPDSGVVRLHETADARSDFVPYTSRALNWHTDGYYNPLGDAVRCFALHCIEPAASGGANRFFDHELAYIRLRDQEPRWMEALSRGDALSIPAHHAAGRERRPAVAGPVFFVDVDGRLRMRFTMRTRHVRWAQDTALQEARDFLCELLSGTGEDIWEYRFAAGEGVVCNNILHCRDAYSDEPETGGRTFLRARYRDTPMAPAPPAVNQTADVLARS